MQDGGKDAQVVKLIASIFGRHNALSILTFGPSQVMNYHISRRMTGTVWDHPIRTVGMQTSTKRKEFEITSRISAAVSDDTQGCRGNAPFPPNP